MFSIKPRAVIFDLDGTLINSAGDILFDLKTAIEAEGLLAPSDLDKNLIGPPMLDIVKGLFPSIDHNTALKIVGRFRSAHDSSSLNNSHLYEGVKNSLDYLRSSDVKIYLATNKPRPGVLNIFNKFKLSQYFSDIACHGDSQIHTKSDAILKLIINNALEKSSSWMVGDAPSDILAAKNNGLFSVAHMGGYSSLDEISKHKPDLILNSMIEFNELVNKLI